MDKFFGIGKGMEYIGEFQYRAPQYLNGLSMRASQDKFPLYADSAMLPEYSSVEVEELERIAKGVLSIVAVILISIWLF